MAHGAITPTASNGNGDLPARGASRRGRFRQMQPSGSFMMACIERPQTARHPARRHAKKGAMAMTAAPRPIGPEDVLRFQTVGEAQISPDGRRVAYTLHTIDRDDDTTRSAIWIVPFDGGAPAQFTSGSHRDSAPRWSPDGSQ